MFDAQSYISNAAMQLELTHKSVPSVDLTIALTDKMLLFNVQFFLQVNIRLSH